MSRARAIFVSLLAAVLASCGGTTVGDTELSVTVPSGEDTVDVQNVAYTIACVGNSDTFLDTGESFADEATLQGGLEVVDNRTSGGVPTEIWQAFMDLPPGTCVLQLAAFDDDGERICMVEQTFTVVEDTLTKLDLVLLCEVSSEGALGMANIDGTFTFAQGNVCPTVITVNALNSAPATGTTVVQARGYDPDTQCGASCDPQTCDNTVVPPVCTPGPDPGFTLTVSATTGTFDCDGDTISDGSACVLTGPQFTTGDVDYICDPALPGAAVTITAVAQDGDDDCDEAKQIMLTCP